MSRAITIMLALLFGSVPAVVCGCGGDKRDPVAACNTYVDRLCARVVDCAQDGTTVAECVAFSRTVASCATAKALGPTYDACLADLATTTCSVLYDPQAAQISPPAACRNIVVR